jgi:hypothetical protein
MYASNINLEQEKKEQKKSRMIAFFFGASLVALALLPLMNNMKPDETKYESVVTIDFSETKFEKASKKPAESGKKGGEVKPEKTEKLPVPEVTPPPPAPPVVTTPKPAPPIKTAPKKVPTPPKKTPTKVVTPPTKPADKVATPADAKTSTPEKTTTPSPKNESGSGNGAGTKGNGKASSSSDGDDVTPGEGDDGMDFSGNGIFGRRVTYRANVKKLAQEEGKIVVNLCVNRVGRVVYAENNEDLSTIKTKSLIQKTINATKKYRFDKDYTANEKECGKLTFIFELDK